MNEKKKKAVIYSIIAVGIIAAAAAVLASFGAFGRLGLTTAAEPTLSPTEVPVPTPTPAPEIKNTIPERGGAVLAGSRLSFGLATSGMLSFIGSNEGQAYCYDWTDIVQIAGSASATVGLRSDGTVLISTADDTLADAVSEWKNVVFVAASDETIYGLLENGRILSAGEHRFGSGFEYVRLMAAGDDFLIAVDAFGAILTSGSAPDVSAFENCGADITALAACGGRAAALTSDGRLVTVGGANPFVDMTGIRKIFITADDTAVIDSDGILRTDCEFITEPIENAVDFSCGCGHALVLLGDGRVLAFGDDEYMQCSVDNWRLLPYKDENGYILGITPGETHPDGRPVVTGDEYTLSNGTSGIAVILGDIDRDGRIDGSDLELLNAYISGEASLDEVQMQAANILRDAKLPESIDAADVEQLNYHLNGFTVIDQYAKDFVYSGEVADAERLNTDTVGYLNLEHTNIVHPIMYGDDFYYHYHNPSHVATSRSSIYLYYPTPVKNIVVTGHNLRQSGLMLHDLHKLQDNYASEYGTFKNRIWTINIFGETHYWEVFAMYEEKPASYAESSQNYNTNYTYTMDTLTDEEIADWISYQVERTELDYTLHVTEKDRFMTFLTCADRHSESNTGGRIYFFLRRVDGH